MTSGEPTRNPKPELPRAPQRKFWGSVGFFLSVVTFTTGLGLYLQHQQSGTRYSATVLACHGGRYNSCDIIVHTAAGDIPATSDLADGTSEGDKVRVVAGGPPPWGRMTEVGGAGTWALIIGLYAFAGLSLFGLAVLWAKYQRVFGLRALFARHPPPLPEWHPY